MNMPSISRPTTVHRAPARLRAGGCSSFTTSRALQALDGEHRELRALGDFDVGVRGVRWRIHARSLSRVPALTTTRNHVCVR